MRWKWGSGLTMSAVLVAQLGATEARQEITVFVYNYAAISPEDLAKTKAEAARIFRHSGVEIQWLDCPRSPREAAQFPACQVPPGPTRLAIRLVSQSMAERMGQASDTFGFALYPEDGSFATVANAFVHRAEQIAKGRRLSRGAVLGHIVAHELGHLLLGADSHSNTGIMRVAWYPRELERIAQGTMTFTASESRRIQRNTRARMAATEAGDSLPGPGNASQPASETLTRK